MKLLIFLVLILYVRGAVQIKTYTDDNILATMATICASAPISNLNMCNNTCQSCSASSSFKCSACSTQYFLEGDTCYIDNNIHNYTIYNYLKDLNADLMIRDIQQFIYGDTNTHIQRNKIMGVCSNNSYELYMAGPFKDTTIVGIDYSFVDRIDRIRIKFNFMAFVQDITLKIEINSKQIFAKKFQIFSDLIGSYGKNPNDTGPNYLFLNALTVGNVASVISPIDTGLQNVISNNIQVRFFIATKEEGYCWGFNDFVVVQRACQTCVTKAVQQLLDKATNITWIVLIVVIALILILFILLKLENLKRKLDFQSKLGSSDSLPLKAINRVMDALQKSTRTMKKEFKKEDKHFERLMKRQ